MCSHAPDFNRKILMREDELEFEFYFVIWFILSYKYIYTWLKPSREIMVFKAFRPSKHFWSSKASKNLWSFRSSAMNYQISRSFEWRGASLFIVSISHVGLYLGWLLSSINWIWARLTFELQEPIFLGKIII